MMCIHPPGSVGTMSGTALLVAAGARGVEGTTRYTPPSEFIRFMLLAELNFFMFMGSKKVVLVIQSPRGSRKFCSRTARHQCDVEGRSC